MNIEGKFRVLSMRRERTLCIIRQKEKENYIVRLGEAREKNKAKEMSL